MSRLSKAEVEAAGLALNELEEALSAAQGQHASAEEKSRAQAELFSVVTRHRGLLAQVAGPVLHEAQHSARLYLRLYVSSDERAEEIMAQDFDALRPVRRAVEVVDFCLSRGADYAQSAAMDMLDVFEWAEAQRDRGFEASSS